MHSRRTSVWARLAIVLALALSISACGSGSDSDVGDLAGVDNPPVQPADPSTPGDPGGDVGDAGAGGTPPEQPGDSGDGGTPPEQPGDSGDGGTPPEQPGDSGDGGTPPEQPVDPTGPGELKAFASLGTISVADIVQALDGSEARSAGLAPVYDVTSYRLEYLTTDAEGREVRASGLVSVPVKAAGAKSPVLSYQHGTIFRNAEAPSNNAVASEVAVVLASLGYIVIAPDYVGYGASLGAHHPYLLAEPSAAAVVDFLTAARTWRRKNDVRDNGQLFLTGYSEGGYVTMAAHRALQTSGAAQLQQLRTVVAGGGPYDVQATLDGLLDLVRDEEPVLGALLDPGLLRHLGSSVREELRRVLLRYLLPGDADVTLDTRFIDRYLADDVQAIAQHSSVHAWKPELPVRLFHGQDDRTVPYASSLSTLRTMQSLGAGGLVSLTDCRAVPSSHIGCVPGFLAFVLTEFAMHVQDL